MTVYWAGDYRNGLSYQLYERYERYETDNYTDNARLGYVIDRHFKPFEYRLNDFVKSIACWCEGNQFGVMFVMLRDVLNITTFRRFEQRLGQQMDFSFRVSLLTDDNEAREHSRLICKEIERAWSKSV